MIAKRIDTKAASPRIARLVRYVVAAQGGIDPRSWSRTADYVLNSGTSSRGEKVGGVRVTNCHTDDPAAATALIECTQAANTRSHTDKTYHLVFSFPPGEEPVLEILHAIEDQLCAAIEYADHQRISAVHIDRDHLHVHVAINKVHPKGYQNIEPYFDKKKLMEECDRLERKYKLKPTNHGLTGEKTHERSNDIRLTQERHPEERDSRSRQHLRESYDLSFGYEPEAESLNGVRNLSGCRMVRTAQRGSLLLPGNARNGLQQRGTERPDSVRRAGDGDRGNVSERVSIPPKQTQAEAHSGIETLTGHVAREVAPAMHKATNWLELHATLAEHGLEIKKRGAGLVIGHTALWVRASQCDRSFSLKALTDRLGPFEESRHNPEITHKPYEPKPRQAHPSSAVLFEQYQHLQLKHKLARSHDLAQLKYKGALLEANLQRWKIAQRLLVKVAAKGPQRRAMLKMVSLQTAATRNANKRAIDAKRRMLMAETRLPSWAHWLTLQAENGNTEAVAVLRSRKEREALRGDLLTAAKNENAENIILKGLKLEADKDGALSYNTADGGLVIDRKTHVQSFRTTAGSSFIALELASKRFKGQALIVEGQADFQKDVARLAGLHKLDVRFADPALEQTRQSAQAKPDKSKSRSKSIDNEAEL
ncbi:TraI/MobA(P) family conjugative relaxase [Nitrosospira sp. NpAV]|uniref:TraI/MobA(P) family conjugative relaxase n=1 Tax=Nitrosospira sp. NpAV TaxID=58133 RepID=UPI0006972E9A|nr:TraI/MobA(P) family conjugative relaxase [Nitrosospira sp. NpAV]